MSIKKPFALTSHSLIRIGVSSPTVRPVMALLPVALRSIDFAPEEFLRSFDQLSCAPKRGSPAIRTGGGFTERLEVGNEVANEIQEADRRCASLKQ